MSNARNLGNITAGGATGATTASVTTSINNLIDAAPGALNTLNELAAALGDDANFSTTMTNSIALKATIDNPTFTTKITTPDIDITGGSQIGQDYAYLKSSSTTNTSLTLRKDSSGADSIDYLQLRSDGNGLISKITGAGALGAGAGTVSLPSLSFVNDTNTGLYSPSADNLGFAIGGTARAFMSNTQLNVNAKIVATELDINGNADISGTLAVSDSVTVLIADGGADNEYAMQIKNQEATDDRSYGLLIHAGSTNTDRALVINDHDGTTPLFYVAGNGFVGIGTTNPEYQLDVLKATGNLVQFATKDDNNGGTNPLSINYNVGLRVHNLWSGAGPSANGTKVAKIQLGTVTTSGYGAYGAIIVDATGTGYDSGEMSFATGSNSSSLMTERMRIDKSGNVHLTGGIDFNDASSIDTSGESNLLNDYETGTWTPKLKDINGNEASAYQSGYPKGTYVKIGRHVWVNFSIRMTNKGSMTGNYVFVANLPFNKDSTAEGRGTGSVDYYSGLATTKSYLALDTTSTVSVFWLVGGTNATGSHYVTVAHLNNTCMLKGGGNYIAT